MPYSPEFLLGYLISPVSSLSSEVAVRPKVPLFFVEAGLPAAVVNMIPAFWFRFDDSISVGWATPAGLNGARLTGMPDLGR